MKKTKIILSTLLAFVLAFAPLSLIKVSADYEASDYKYTFKVHVDNACNSKDMDKDAVNDLFFEFTYKDKNGYGSEQKYKFDMSWSNGRNRNSDFLWKYFIRSSDSGYDTEFDIYLPGKMSKMYIKLNMDGGERLGFTVKSIWCNGKQINTNTDWVSSAYYDSKANIYTSMESSVIDRENSQYFRKYEDAQFTYSDFKKIVSDVHGSGMYDGMFVDQYNSMIDVSVLDKCVGDSDGEINQFYSHADEVGMYKYTLYFNVENPCNLNDADHDEFETFYIDFHYKADNGYGDEKTYRFDMQYSKDKKSNLNQYYAEKFTARNDNSKKIHFSVWVPGIVTKINMKLNMSGEKLCADLERVKVGGLQVNTNRDYVSSVYWDSSATINCSVPSAKIAVSADELPSSYSSKLVDQYGALVSENLYNKAKADTSRYLYN